MNTFSAHARLAQIHEASRPGAFIGMDPSWWGFGGLHGGLALSLLTAAMRDRSQGRVLQQVSGRFRRALRAPFCLEVHEPSAGKTVSWLDADAVEEGRVAISASAVFAVPGQEGAQAIAPPMPAAPPSLQCPIFTVPPEFVPFARHTEIRPVGSARPFGGAAEPELIAWLRLVDDDLPPDEARLIVLMDALAPSYAAILRTPVPIPTVTFTVTPSSDLAQATSPWVLLRARTDTSRRDGWLLERLDAWTPDGAHIGSAEQLRAVMDRA
ncbi:MAG: thioesterase family protein [Ottowia sp.]|uniref:thioesterase family protein n=1 Tax=Ottowia sp. TaxID=1898956 RepID=UPI0039E315A6